MSVQTTINVVRKIEFWDGFRFAWGATFFIVIVMLLSMISDDLWGTKFDDSDAPPRRSGLHIKTDNLSGCQYFVTFTGSITPRMNRDGKQICK